MSKCDSGSNRARENYPTTKIRAAYPSNRARAMWYGGEDTADAAAAVVKQRQDRKRWFRKHPKADDTPPSIY